MHHSCPSGFGDLFPTFKHIFEGFIVFFAGGAAFFSSDEWSPTIHLDNADWVRFWEFIRFVSRAKSSPMTFHVGVGSLRFLSEQRASTHASLGRAKHSCRTNGSTCREDAC